MSWGYDATASLAPLNFNPAYSPAATNANLAALNQQQQVALSPTTLYGPGGYGAMTDYYSQLAANQLSGIGSTNPYGVFSGEGIGGVGSPAYGYGSLYGGGDAAAPPSAYDYGSLYGGGGGGGFGGLGGGGGDFSGYDYNSLYGGGGAATPPSAFGYGSLYSPPAAPDPLSYQSMAGGSGGLFQGGFPSAGGYPVPSAQRLLGYDPTAGPSQTSSQTPSMGYDYGSLYGGGGAGNLGSRLAQTLIGGDGGVGGYGGPFQSAFGSPLIGTSPGMAPNFGGFDNFGGGGPSAYGNTSLYGSGDAATPPSAYGYGSLGGGVYDPFNVGGQLDPALYGPGGLGGGSGLGQAPAPMPDLQRLLGYTPRQLSALPDRSGLDTAAAGGLDVQGGIDSLQQTLGGIDRATGGGYTLSPQDRDIPFRGPGGASAGASPYADEGPYAGLGLPPEITQGGSIPSSDPYPGFARSLFGDAPVYPSGVVRGPYELPDITPQRAQDPFSGGGPLPFTREDPFADFGLPPEITQGFSGRSAFGFDPATFDQGFGNPRGFDSDPTFGLGPGFSGDRPSGVGEDAYNYGSLFGSGAAAAPPSEYGYGSLALPFYPDQTFAPGDYTQATVGGGGYGTTRQQLDLQIQRAPQVQQIDADPALQRKVMATAIAEVGEGASDEEKAQVIETLLDRGAAHDLPLGSKQMLASGPGVYYQPLRPGQGENYNEAYAKLGNDPAYFGKHLDIWRKVAAGSNVSNLGTGNASGYSGRYPMGADALQRQGLGGYGPYAQEQFPVKDINPPAHPYYTSPSAWQNFGQPFVKQERAWYDALMPPRQPLSIMSPALGQYGNFPAQAGETTEQYLDRLFPGGQR